MHQEVSDTLLSSLYLLLWILTFIWYHWKRRAIDAGSAIIGTYVLYAFFSILSVNNQILFIEYKPLTFFPFIYLYIMLMIALSPGISNHLNPPTNLLCSNTKILEITGIVIIIASISLIPNIISNFSEGFVKLFTDTDAGKDAYMESINESDERGNGISSITNIIFNATSTLSYFIYFYFISASKKNWYMIVGLSVAIIVGFLVPIMQGLRGGVIITILTLILAYMLYKPFLSIRLKRVVQTLGIAGMIAVMIPIVAITMSRFGKEKAGVESIMYWYIGQENLYFNNYGLDNGGIRYGDRTFNLFKRLVDPNTSKNYVERRDKFHHLKSNDDIFTSFVGDFALDFGPVGAFVIFVVFNVIVVYHTRPRDGTIKLHQLLLLYFALSICMQGGMSLYNFADGGNLQIVMIFLIYFYLRYYEALQEKFPLKTDPCE
ncbi:MAG: oligosaccharide repeat unit polymerase [Prevotella sp.]|nr:oligosaccharide repeat unit polymerase [Prevotella sp.]